MIWKEVSEKYEQKQGGKGNIHSMLGKSQAERLGKRAVARLENVREGGERLVRLDAFYNIKHEKLQIKARW